jgi:hypothetical protein
MFGVVVFYPWIRAPLNPRENDIITNKFNAQIAFTPHQNIYRNQVSWSVLLSVPIRCPVAEILNGTCKWHHRHTLLIANLQAYWPHERRRSGCSVVEFVISHQQRFSFKFSYDVYKAERGSRQICCSVQKIRYSDTRCKNDLSIISQKENGREINLYSDSNQAFFALRIREELWVQRVPSLYMLYLRN